MRFWRYYIAVSIILLATSPIAASPLSLWVNTYPNLLAVNSNYGNFLAGPFDAWYGESATDIDNLPDGVHVGMTYCIDLHHDLDELPDEYYAVDRRDSEAGFDDQQDRTGDLRQVAWLVNTYGDQAGGPYEWASMQVAIWKLLYPGYVYLGGLPDTNRLDFLLSQAAGKQAAHWHWFDYQGPVNGGQDMITAVPEPATLLLFGIGLAGFGLLLHRRR